MIKTLLSTTAMLVLWAGSAAAQSKQGSANSGKASVKFLDNITVSPAPVEAAEVSNSNWKAEYLSMAKKEPMSVPGLDIEAAQQIQFKYALLLDTEVEMAQSISLFLLIDEWLGTRYRLGGSTKAGIDCSALMQTLFSAQYNISLPRTAREQYAMSQRISRTDLKEGDLVFFNTTGGVSHVGLYLQNNKFLHASSSGGVMISDLYDDYWVKRFVGVGRIDEGASFAVSKS